MKASVFTRRAFNRWPGAKRFGVYRFLPLFFVAGGLVELCMIKWRVGDVNFYSVFKEKQATREALRIIQAEDLDKSATQGREDNSDKR